MWPPATWLNKLAKVTDKLSSLAPELHLLMGVAEAALITLIFKLITLTGGTPNALEYVLVLVIGLIAILHGPLVAAVGGFLVGMLLSPMIDYGLSDQIHGESYFWPLRTLVFTLIGFAIGTLMRMLQYQQQRATQAELQVEGTNLPNLKATLEYLETAITKPEPEPEGQLNMVNVRVQNMDQLRQQFSKHELDALLVQMADKFKQRLGADAYVTQTASNELVGFNRSRNQEAFQKLQQDIQKLMAEPDFASVKSKGKQIDLATYAGVYGVGNKAKSTRSVEDLIKELTTTTQRAVDARQSVLTQTAPDNLIPQAEDIGAFSVKRQLQDAMTKHELKLFYEPRLNTATGYFSSLEVVPVWEHPRRGQLGLAEFLPMLQEAAMVQYFAMWMIRRALEDAHEWHKKGYKFRISLKVSLTDKVDPRVLSFLMKEVQVHPMESGLFNIEVIEKALLEGDQKIIDYLTHLQHNGLNIIVDGFGGSNATVQTLFRMPVDALKFNETFVRNAEHHSDKKRELYSLIKMVRAKGLTTIAQGVETRGSLLMLKQIGCDELQGPILSKPLPKKDIPWARIR